MIRARKAERKNCFEIKDKIDYFICYYHDFTGGSGGFVVWGVANYHINAIEQTYGISGEEYREFKQSLGTLNDDAGGS